MGALPWICALQFGAVLCSFEGSEPIHDGEPPAVRGDAPRGLFTPRWVELRQTYGIERPQGRRSEIYIHLTSSLMTLLAALTICVTSGHKSNGGSGESTMHLPPPVCPYCNT